MRHKVTRQRRSLMNTSIFMLWLTLTLFATVSNAKPLEYEDVVDLLPPVPNNINDTMAAIVDDPVVKDAVHYAAGNGTLNGLIVKRKVFIMPASDPNKVLTKREQVLVVPTDHLEDVRKNITETKEAETDVNEITTTIIQTLESNVDENKAKESESGLRYMPNEFLEEPQRDMSDNDVTPKPKIPEAGIILRSTVNASKKASVPILAVIDPLNFNHDKVESSIIAVIGNQGDEADVKAEVAYLNENREKIRKQAQAHIDRTSLAIDPDNLELSTASLETVRSLSRSQDTIASSQDEDISSSYDSSPLLASIVMPNLGLISTGLLESNEGIAHLSGMDDMDVAEDIVFRPLFRYRQEEQQRSKYREEANNYRRTNYRRYNPYQNYDSYPRRQYHYRTRYYDDYD